MADTSRAGEWVVARLAERGVERVFGIPGVHTIPLYAGLAGGAIEHVTARHEQGVGFMADAYARVSGRPGVCFVITGPGITNIATAMAQAYADSIPMLVLSSVSARRHLGRGLGELHELRDQRALTAGVSVFSHTLQALADLPAVLDRAFMLFAGNRPRPVHIEIPLDLWAETPPDSASPPAAPAAPAQPAETHLTDAAARLEKASRPVILAGGGARRAAEWVTKLAGQLDAPAVMTVNGRGLLGSDHPLAVSASPSLSSVRELISGSDATLAVGTEIGPTDYDMYERGMPDLGQTLIRLDIDPLQMTQPRAADVPLLGDASTVLGFLLERTRGAPADRDGAERARRARTGARDSLGTPMRRGLELLETVRDALPDALIVGDSTHPVYAGNLYFAATRPGSWFNSATGYGTLGYALPASLGAALATPERPVVCLVGDGGLQFSLGDLGSIRDQDRAIIVVVWDNAGFGEIKLAMEAEGVTPVGVDLYTPDLEKLAAAYGCAFAVPENLQALPGVLDGAVKRRRPTLVRIDEARFL